MPKSLSERNGGRRSKIVLFLFDLEGFGHLPTYPQVGSKPM